MPVPQLVARINKRVFNPREIKKGKRPVLRHVGRASGSTYRTPLDAHEVEGSYFFILMYGPESDWVQNILEAGRATLELENDEIALENPKVMTGASAWELLPSTIERPPRFLNVTQLLRMDKSSSDPLSHTGTATTSWSRPA